MRIRKVLRKKLDSSEGGVHVAGGVNAVVAANVGEKGGSHTSVSSRQRIVQRNGKTVVDETEIEGRESQ